MQVEFLSDEQVAGYGRFTEEPSRLDLERCCWLSDTDRVAVADRRGDHNRLGFAVQLATVRLLGRFLVDPVEVPWSMVEFLAEQLDIGEAPRAWLTTDGPTVFVRAVGWLRDRKVLLPGVTVLARLVARVRSEQADRLHAAVIDAAGGAGVGERLEGLLVAGDDRGPELERLRPVPGMVVEPQMTRVARPADTGRTTYTQRRAGRTRPQHRFEGLTCGIGRTDG